MHSHIPPPPPFPRRLQLSYFHRLFDMESLMHSLNSKEAQAAAADRLAPIRDVLDAAAAATAKVRDASAFRWVNIGSMFNKLSTRA
jgi:hypothetical protein